MSALTEYLNSIGIYNDHGLVRHFGTKGKDVWVHFRPHGRALHGGALVASPSHKTDPKAHFADYGAKCFAGAQASTMPKAVAWAEKTYGITEWSGSPFGGGKSNKVPTYIVEAAQAAKKAAKSTK